MTKNWIAALFCFSALTLVACGDGDEGRVSDVDQNPLEPKDNEEDFNDGMAGALGDDDNPVLLDEEIAEEEGERLDPALVTLSEVRIPSDIQALVDNSFERADTNDDGVLAGEEYLIVAPALGQSDNNIGRPDGDEPGASAVGTADTQGETGLPEGWVAAGRDDFIRDITGGTMEVSREDMGRAFAERYEVADADGNDILEDDEIVTLGRLALAIQE
jgi:hypothetical protein